MLTAVITSVAGITTVITTVTTVITDYKPSLALDVLESSLTTIRTVTFAAGT